ncbi:alkaline phosphatase family protein [Chitinophaga silvatica]|uniref:Alkaline phosphatase family protein n=1 Tax=Chitinophaga silvatica TaxID=2282649 RepID=A0A3E1Y7A7_9BACT|nr:alkaline phosphatase PafA [Chitinophaga silvatica]RFS20970.1 alkaline phosphatase family protein [Chitinophaga silvatica]
MKFTRFLTAALIFPVALMAQKATSPAPFNQSVSKSNKAIRPKLIVGVVVDQMRWDYLYRYNNRYTAGGFKRLLQDGFSCENTLINYTPTITALGHSCVYTGSVPAIHGIAGNDWYSRQLDRLVYCTEDSTVTTVGASGKSGKMSPRNLKVTTIGDELRLSNNFQSKVVGVAIKDRGAILPAGHSANAAFWYDGGSGNFVTSTYYMKELPGWAQSFNNEKLPQQYLSKPWTTLYPINTYVLSTGDEKPYEGKYKNATNTSFPHDLTANPNGSVANTPFGNTLTLEFAKKAIEGYGLGKSGVTDLLAISISSTDKVGHQFGPNAVEIEDTYLRLDQDLASFFKYLDAKIGKGQYLFFITADHGVAHVPGFMEENNLPGGIWDAAAGIKELNQLIASRFGVNKAILEYANYQLYLDHDAIEKAGKNEVEINKFITKWLIRQPAILNAFPLTDLAITALPEPMKSMITNGYNAKNSGDIQIVLQSGYLDEGPTGTSHGLWNPYDSHIPLVWMGWGINHGKTNRTIGMTDIAPTIAALLQIQMPSGNIGQVIQEITH